MRKLHLSLDELTVATFEVDAADGPRGTVEANVSGVFLTCRTCPTINGTCCTPRD